MKQKKEKKQQEDSMIIREHSYEYVKLWPEDDKTCVNTHSSCIVHDHIYYTVIGAK